jgi:hypothetical protein
MTFFHSFREAKIEGRCAVPGCQARAVIRVYEPDGDSADILCVLHGREELEVAAKFGGAAISDAASALLR